MKKHFLKLIAVEAKSLIGQKKYVQKALKSKKLEDWERKEYEAVYEEILKRQKELKIRINNVQQLGEGKLTEKKQGYVVASIYGDLYTPKAVSEKKALKMLDKMSEWGGDKIFMLGVEAWNKPHKLNKKKKMVKEGKLTEKSAISLNLWIKEFERLAKRIE